MKQPKNCLDNVNYMPYWLDNPDKPTANPPLETDIVTDLLIVGGGFTGLWAALLAKEDNPHRNVTLIEAKEVANGASGRPGGIMSSSVMHGLSNAAHYYPDELEILEQLGHENIKAFRTALEKYNIDCDAEWTGEMTVSVGKDGLDTLDHEAELHDQFDKKVEQLDKQDIREEINSPLFYGGLWQKQNCGVVNPAKLVWGLKKTVLDLGVILYENTPLLKVKHSKKAVTVLTPKGRIAARRVLLATNAFAAGHNHIRHRVAAIRDRILATNPLTDEQMERINWQNRQGIYDTRTQLNYMRLTRNNRIIFGGRLGYYFNDETDPNGDKKPEPYYRLAEAFYRTFPDLTDVTFSHAWSGPIGLTTRKAVHFQRYLDGRMIYAGGYSGFGVTASRFGARIALGLLDDKVMMERDLEFVKTLPGYLPSEPFRWIGAKITMYALDTMDEKGGWRIPWIKMVEKMGFPLTL